MAIRGHQWPSVAIRGYQWPSEVIRGHPRPSAALGLRSCCSERANQRGHRSSAARPDRRKGISERPSNSTTGCPGSFTDIRRCVKFVKDIRRCVKRRPPAVEDGHDSDAQDDAGAHKSSRVGKMSRASTGAMISTSRGASRSVRPGTAMSSGMRVASSCNVYLDHRACWPRAKP